MFGKAPAPSPSSFPWNGAENSSHVYLSRNTGCLHVPGNAQEAETPHNGFAKTPHKGLAVTWWSPRAADVPLQPGPVFTAELIPWG